jgi:transcription elongation factor GreA
MAEQPVYLTRQRMREVEQELHEMKSRGREENARMIAEARAHGDLSENSEYDAAKNRQQLHEYRVMQLERMLMSARIIDDVDLPNDRVTILSLVVVENTATLERQSYLLVSQDEADFEQNKISVTSPIGKALLGKTLGAEVEVTVPAGKVTFKIVELGRV